MKQKSKIKLDDDFKYNVNFLFQKFAFNPLNASCQIGLPKKILNAFDFEYEILQIAFFFKNSYLCNHIIKIFIQKTKLKLSILYSDF